MYISDLSEDDIEIAIKVRKLLYSQIFSCKKTSAQLRETFSSPANVAVFYMKEYLSSRLQQNLCEYDLGQVPERL